MLLGGAEYGLLPAQTSDSAGRTKTRKPTKRSQKSWLAGELIVRCEQQQGLTELPDELFRKTGLRQLCLSGNALTCLPPALGCLRELRVLRLARNTLQQLPPEVQQLRHLELLELQHNQLELVPTGLAKLVKLRVVNLDGNPLSQALMAGGPTCRQVWLQQAGSSQQRAAAPPPAATAADADQSESKPEQLKQRTQALLAYLLRLLTKEEVAAVKQARLALMQQEARSSIKRLLHVADPAALQACATVAQHAGITGAELAAIQAAQAAVADLQAAVDSANKETLAAALRQFEDLCGPRVEPEGPVYEQALMLWRRLQREQLARGWRLAPAAAAPDRSSGRGTGCSRGKGAPQRRPLDDYCGRDGDGDDCYSDGSDWEPCPSAGDQAAAGSPQQQQQLAWQQFRRQQLVDAGVPSYHEWLAEKAALEEGERARYQARAAALREEQAAAARERAEEAVRHAALEQGWATRLPAPYPAGTFSPSPDQLEASRKLQFPLSNTLSGGGGSGGRAAASPPAGALLAAQASDAGSADTDTLLEREW